MLLKGNELILKFRRISAKVVPDKHGPEIISVCTDTEVVW